MHHHILLFFLRRVSIHLQIEIGHVHRILLIHFVVSSFLTGCRRFFPQHFRLLALGPFSLTAQQLLNIFILNDFLVGAHLTGDSRMLFHTERIAWFVGELFFAATGDLVTLLVGGVDYCCSLDG